MDEVFDAEVRTSLLKAPSASEGSIDCSIYSLQSKIPPVTDSSLPRNRHLYHPTLVVEERGPIQEERDRFRRGDALHFQVLIGCSFPYEDSVRKGAVCVYNDANPGCNYLHRYLSKEEPVQ